MSKLKLLIGLQRSNLSVWALGRGFGLSAGAVSKISAGDARPAPARRGWPRALGAAGLASGHTSTVWEVSAAHRRAAHRAWRRQLHQVPERNCGAKVLTKAFRMPGGWGGAAAIAIQCSFLSMPFQPLIR